MCGIAGTAGWAPDRARELTEAMCEQMVPRGPDDGGVSLFEAHAGTISLGNRRLAIIDPSPAGHQPMIDDGTQVALAFNGMIYNFRELTRELEQAGHRFRSDCDTEVVLRAYVEWGVDCVTRLRGMFAIAVWDPREDALLLARDRLGIKPLYYHRSANGLLFASQIKALLRTGAVPCRLSPAGVSSFLSFGAVSDPLTAIADVRSLPAGHFAIARAGELTIERFWRVPDEPTLELTREEAVEGLRERLDDAVDRHLVADAPLGVFLSGGLDSSLLAALAVRRSDHVRTLSVVFEDSELSEHAYSTLVAERLGCDHTPVALGGDDLLRWSIDAFGAMDQPSFDGINTHVVSRAAARSGLKVAVSGLGADELFDGYDYVARTRTLDRMRRVPAPIGRAVAPVAARLRRGPQAAKTAAWIGGELPAHASYELLRRLFLPSEVRRLQPDTGLVGIPLPAAVRNGRSRFSSVSAIDLENYTKNVLLRDTDAMSMAESLEVRVPFLDHPLVEWALQLPAEVKQGAERKSLLVEAARDVLPREVLERRKQGFVLPLDAWMRTELRSDVEDTLAGPPPALADLLDPRELWATWRRYLDGEEGWHRPWALYSLCRWAGGLTA
jgi:asparagine synthase (glutamine-hydrolysing)